MSTPRHKMAAEPPETLFTTKKKFGGGSQKIRRRVFLVGLARAGVGTEPIRLS
jgi:hypothetical protein